MFNNYLGSLQKDWLKKLFGKNVKELLIWLREKSGKVETFGNFEPYFLPEKSIQFSEGFLMVPFYLSVNDIDRPKLT